MVCGQCGTTNDEGQRFCFSCGARLAAVTAVQNSPQQTIPVQQLPPMQQLPPVQPSTYQVATYTQTTTVGVIPNSSLAVVSLVAGIFGLVFFFIPFVSSIVAVVCGHMARRQIRQSGGRLAGDGMALLGLVLGYAYLGLAAAASCAFVGLLFLGIAAG